MDKFDELYSVAFFALRDGSNVNVSSAVFAVDSNTADKDAMVNDLCTEELNKRYPLSDGFTYGYFSPPQRVPEDYIMTVALNVLRKEKE